MFAVAGVLTALAALASAGVTPDPQDASRLAVVFAAVVVVAGPPMCYSLARVLRPHPEGTGRERQWRHWAAAVATAYGTSMLGVLSAPSAPGANRWWLFDPDGGGGLLLVQACAAVIGPVTVVWGLAAVLWRAVDRRWPGHLSTPGFVRIDDDAEAEDARIAAHRDRTRAP